MEGYIRDKCYFSTVDYGNRMFKALVPERGVELEGALRGLHHIAA